MVRLRALQGYSVSSKKTFKSPSPQWGSQQQYLSWWGDHRFDLIQADQGFPLFTSREAAWSCRTVGRKKKRDFSFFGHCNLCFWWFFLYFFGINVSIFSFFKEKLQFPKTFQTFKKNSKKILFFKKLIFQKIQVSNKNSNSQKKPSYFQRMQFVSK